MRKDLPRVLRSFNSADHQPHVFVVTASVSAEEHPYAISSRLGSRSMPAHASALRFFRVL